MSERDPLAVMVEEAFKEARRQGMSVAAAADIVVQVLRAKQAEAELEQLSSPDVVAVQSIVGARTGDPYVQCRVGFEQWQWDVESARHHAMAVLACAEAAMHDAATVRWLILGPLDVPQATAWQAVSDLRRFRGDVDRADWRPAAGANDG